MKGAREEKRDLSLRQASLFSFPPPSLPPPPNCCDSLFRVTRGQSRQDELFRSPGVGAAFTDPCFPVGAEARTLPRPWRIPVRNSARVSLPSPTASLLRSPPSFLPPPLPPLMMSDCTEKKNGEFFSFSSFSSLPLSRKRLTFVTNAVGTWEKRRRRRRNLRGTLLRS